MAPIHLLGEQSWVFEGRREPFYHMSPTLEVALSLEFLHISSSVHADPHDSGKTRLCLEQTSKTSSLRRPRSGKGFGWQIYSCTGRTARPRDLLSECLIKKLEIRWRLATTTGCSCTRFQLPTTIHQPTTTH